MKKFELLLLITIVAVIGIFVSVYLPGYSKYNDLKAKEERLNQQIEALSHKNAKMAEEINLLKTDVDYLEKVMRNEMGLVKPGEVVYKIVEDGVERE